MKRIAIVLGLLAMFLVKMWIARPSAEAAGDLNDETKILRFQTMVGVSGPYLGAANAIRGIGGGGAPWEIDDAKGELRADGEIDIKVRGLVLVSTGANPVTDFKAIVSCLSIDANNQPITVNVETGLFPADAEGNCLIADQVDLPDPCIAPIVFVTNPAGRWFAATGF
jgi:hypothetical protein